MESWGVTLGPERTLGGFSPQRPCIATSTHCGSMGPLALLGTSELFKRMDSQCLAKHFSAALGWLGLEVKVNPTSGPFRHRGTEHVPRGHQV